MSFHGMAKMEKDIREDFINENVKRDVWPHKKEHDRNDYIQEKIDVAPIEQKMIENQLRRRGRPRRNLKKAIKGDLMVNNIPKAL
ncbi:hypothetical protein CR513_01474, partial [Mucuna pruriens]